MPAKLQTVIVFFDADALIAGSASHEGAAFVLLQMSELGLIKGFTCQKAIDECRKNLQNKLPDALPAFEKCIATSIAILVNPTKKEAAQYKEMAHPKDCTILTSALQINADFLVTFNTKDFFPKPDLGLKIVKPGDLLKEIRAELSRLLTSK